MDSIKLLTTDEVAEILRKSPAQLSWMRHKGSGPRSAKIGGRVMYRETDIVEYVNAAFEAEGTT
jgi:predicted DNA-binding transcriptional regulator AlpA